MEQDQPCDFVVAPRILRTVKFICGLARGVEILSTTFLDAAIETNSVPPPEDHKLKDPKSETQLDVKLALSVRRAKAHRGKLLAGVPVYCTEKITSGFESYQMIAQANGALFKIYHPRSGTTIKPTTAEEDGGAAPEPVYLLSTNKPEEKTLHERFREMAVKGHMEPRIVVPEWLLDVAMVQQVRFDERYLVDNFRSEQGR